MADFFERRARKYRRVLELAVLEEDPYYRNQRRRIFEACRANGYNVLGYKEQLEQALVIVNRAIAAIKAIEGK